MALTVNAFSEEYMDTLVRFQIVWMTGSAWVWVGIGEGGKSMGNMSAAMLSTFGSDQGVSATVLLGGTSGEYAKRLAAKLGKEQSMMKKLDSRYDRIDDSGEPSNVATLLSFLD